MSDSPNPPDSNLAHLRKLDAQLLDPSFHVRLTELIGAAIVAVDQEGDIRIFNNAAELLFGYHRSEVLGQKVEILVPAAFRGVHADTHRPEFSHAPRARPMGQGGPLLARHKLGREFPVEINLVPIPTVDGVVTAAVIWPMKRTSGGG